MLSITVKAHAKVNWHLKIGPKSPNGYHTIESVFQKISLHDVIKVTLTSHGETALQQGLQQEKVTGLEKYVASGKSTIDKVIELWKKKTGCTYDIFVDVQKNIPAKSGLGGGSSDAASVLLALNSLDIRLSFDELLDIALEVGCDVPFFLHSCAAACVFGMGEVVLPIKERHDLQGFLILPKVEKTSTKDAFEALDEQRGLDKDRAFDNCKALSYKYTKPYTQWNYCNDFESVNAIINTKPQVKVFEDERLLLTGSGNCRVLLSNRKTLTIENCLVMPFSTQF